MADDDLTTAYLAGYHQRDDIIRAQAALIAEARKVLATYACKCKGSQPLDECASGDLWDCGFRARVLLAKLDAAK
jgi:hypothetical protein